MFKSGPKIATEFARYLFDRTNYSAKVKQCKPRYKYNANNANNDTSRMLYRKNTVLLRALDHLTKRTLTAPTTTRTDTRTNSLHGKATTRSLHCSSVKRPSGRVGVRGCVRALSSDEGIAAPFEDLDLEER